MLGIREFCGVRRLLCERPTLPRTGRAHAQGSKCVVGMSDQGMSSVPMSYGNLHGQISHQGGMGSFACGGGGGSAAGKQQQPGVGGGATGGVVRLYVELDLCVVGYIWYNYRCRRAQLGSALFGMLMILPYLSGGHFLCFARCVQQDKMCWVVGRGLWAWWRTNCKAPNRF